MTQFNIARVSGNRSPNNPDLAMSLALSSGDFEEASRLIDSVKNDEARKRYQELLVKLKARALLTSSDVIGALSYIRRIEDRNARLGYYLSALTAAEKKKDPTISNLVVNEARPLIPQVDRNGIHTRLLLAFVPPLSRTSSDEAIEFLETAVTAINSLPRAATPETPPKSPTEAALAELNNPQSFLGATELENAFSSLGPINLERTLIEAKSIEIKPIELAARLAAIQGVIRSESKKAKSKPTIPVSQEN